MTEAQFAAAARAIMLADGCGLTIEGERVFCDDPRADDFGENPRECMCKIGARAALTAAAQVGEGRGADIERFDWLQEQIVDTVYLDDGRIIDVRGGDIRKAIDQAGGSDATRRSCQGMENASDALVPGLEPIQRSPSRDHDAGDLAAPAPLGRADGGWRYVRLADLTAILSMLPPPPVEKDGVKFFYADRHPVTRLHQIRDAFQAMLAAPSPPVQSVQWGYNQEIVMRLRSHIATVPNRSDPGPHHVMAEAATCIESLEARVMQEIHEYNDKFRKLYDAQMQIATLTQALAEAEKKIYVPGQWRCAKCDFRLTQSNLYVTTGAVGPRDEPGDKCPNCNGPLWRVSAMEDRNEAFKCANDAFDRCSKAEAKLAEADKVIEPFAKGADELQSVCARDGWAVREDCSMTVGHLRAARAWRELNRLNA